MSHHKCKREVVGVNIDINCVSTSDTLSICISNIPSLARDSTPNFIQIYGEDLELLYNTLHKFLGKK